MHIICLLYAYYKAEYMHIICLLYTGDRPIIRSEEKLFMRFTQLVSLSLIAVRVSPDASAIS
jgi:hypothetical protein